MPSRSLRVTPRERDVCVAAMVCMSALEAVTESDKFRYKSAWYISSVGSILLRMPSGVVRELTRYPGWLL